jgi:hypothetical protein
MIRNALGYPRTSLDAHHRTALSQRGAHGKEADGESCASLTHYVESVLVTKKLAGCTDKTRAQMRGHRMTVSRTYYVFVV